MLEATNFYPLLSAGLEYTGFHTIGSGYGVYFAPKERRVFGVVRWVWMHKCTFTVFADDNFRYYNHRFTINFNKRNGDMSCFYNGKSSGDKLRVTTLPQAEPPYSWSQRITIKGYSYQTSIMKSSFSIIELVVWRKYFLRAHEHFLTGWAGGKTYIIHN